MIYWSADPNLLELSFYMTARFDHCSKTTDANCVFQDGQPLFIHGNLACHWPRKEPRDTIITLLSDCESTESWRAYHSLGLAKKFVLIQTREQAGAHLKHSRVPANGTCWQIFLTNMQMGVPYRNVYCYKLRPDLGNSAASHSQLHCPFCPITKLCVSHFGGLLTSL